VRCGRFCPNLRPLTFFKMLGVFKNKLKKSGELCPDYNRHERHCLVRRISARGWPVCFLMCGALMMVTDKS
jgi:hypothetical protein